MTKGGSRKGDPSSSKKAAQDTDATKLENICYAALHQATITDGKWNGRWVNCFEWCRLAGIKLSACTPRGKPMWIKGYVERAMMKGFTDTRAYKDLWHYRVIIPRRPLEEQTGYQPPVSEAPVQEEVTI